MPFDWRFRNFKRDPEPFLNGAVIDAENARNNLVQNAGNDMEGYRPLASTLAAQVMEGYKPVVPATQSQLAAGASQAMQGYTPNVAGRPFVPNNMHGGMGRPDLEGYGESLQAASDAAAQKIKKEQDIADIESQIAFLEKRIAENKVKLQNFAGNADQIAAIEARKINTADPTSIWRWKVDRDEARRIAKMEKENTKKLNAANALIEATNTIENMVVDPLMDTSTKNSMLSKLADIKSNLQKQKLPTKMVDDKIKEIKGESVQTTEASANTGLPFRGTPKEKGTAQADNIIQKGIEKVTQKEIKELKRQVESGELIVNNEKMNEIDDLYNKVVDRDNQRALSRRYEEARKKFNIPKERWNLMSKAKRKEYLEKSGV